MDWQPVATLITSNEYVFTPIVNDVLFKIKHITPSPLTGSLKIVIRQAFIDNGELAFFDYKLINCKAEQDIVLFSHPTGLPNRMLAIKRVDSLLNEDWTIEIKSLALIEDGVNLPITISDVTDLQQRLDSIQNELTLKALEIDLDNHASSTNNPHGVTASQVGADALGSAANAVVVHESTVNHAVATTNAKGMMAAADKSKLDSIAPGATVNASNAYLLERTHHQGMQPISSIEDLSIVLDNFVDNSSNESIAGIKTFTVPANFLDNIFANVAVHSKAYYFDGTPLSLNINRAVSTVVNDFAEIGNFRIDNGGIVFRLSLVISDPGFSLAKTYTVSTVYCDGNSGWLKLNPEKASIYAYYNDCEIDIKMVAGYTYLRLRRSGATANEGIGRVRLEFLGATDTAFIETTGIGNDPNVTGSY